MSDEEYDLEISKELDQTINERREYVEAIIKKHNGDWITAEWEISRDYEISATILRERERQAKK